MTHTCDLSTQETDMEAFEFRNLRAARTKGNTVFKKTQKLELALSLVLVFLCMLSLCKESGRMPLRLTHHVPILLLILLSLVASSTVHQACVVSLCLIYPLHNGAYRKTSTAYDKYTEFSFLHHKGYFKWRL